MSSQVESKYQKIGLIFDLLEQLRSDTITSDGEVTWRRLKKKVVIICDNIGNKIISYW